MNYRMLGKTGIKVSEIGIGAWPIGGALKIAGRPFSYGNVDKHTALQTLDIAFKLGINFIDTADFYGLGRSEYLIGEAFHGNDDVIIVTKAGYIADGINGSSIDISYHHLMAAAKRSLERLQRKHIDIFLVHVPPVTESQWEDARSALNALKEKGVIRHSGISIGSKFKEALNWLHYPEVEVVEVFYNMFYREYELEVLNVVKKNNIGVIAASPLSRGILSHSVSKERKFEDTDVRNRWINNDPTFIDLMLKRDNVLDLLARYRLPITGSALAFVLKEDTISSVVPGMKSPKHVRQNIKEVYNVNYTQDFFDELNSA